MDNNQTVKRIKDIVTGLKSKEIIDYLNQWDIDKIYLLKLVVESKIGYDQSIADKRNKDFFDEIEESKVYSLVYYSELIMFISNISDSSRSVLQSNNTLHNFFLFHKILDKTSTLVMHLLSDSEVEEHTEVETPVQAEKPRAREYKPQPRESRPQPKEDKVAEKVLGAKLGGKLHQMPPVTEEQPVEDVTLGKFLKSLASY